MSTMIETKNLTFQYPVEEGRVSRSALKDVNVAIEKGSFTVVLGHNGSGKSTLAKHMNAVLLPCGGNVYVAGTVTSADGASRSALWVNGEQQDITALQLTTAKVMRAN